MKVYFLGFASQIFHIGTAKKKIPMLCSFYKVFVLFCNAPITVRLLEKAFGVVEGRVVGEGRSGIILSSVSKLSKEPSSSSSP